MAEFCKDCFNEINGTHKDEDIIMSEHEEYCEGCNSIKQIVVYVKEVDDNATTNQKSKESTCKTAGCERTIGCLLHKGIKNNRNN